MIKARFSAWRPALAALFLAAAPLAANAHPHVFAQARLEIETSPDGAIVELRHVWRFDEVFSSSVLLDFDANTNLVLDPEELVKIGDVVKESLAEFDYYTTITADGADIGIAPPDVLAVDYQDGQLLMLFAVRPKVPLVMKGKLAFGVYDPTLYAALDFENDSDMVVTGQTSSQCEPAVIRPDPDEIIEQNRQSLTAAFYETTGQNDLSKLLATRLELTCS